MSNSAPAPRSGAETMLLEQFSLRGEVAIVTGGGGGIGRAVALLYGRLGAHTVILDRDGETAAAAAAALVEAGASAESHQLDVTDEGAVSKLFDDIARRHGRIDILVNNAGIVLREPTIAISLAAWQQVLDVNLTGVFLCARNAARHMIRAGSGRILNVASIGGLSGGRLYPNASYRASKGGVVNLTRALAVEWAAHNIRVNAVAPGYVKTPMTTHITADAERRAALERTIPLGRMAEPEDLAWPIIFLTSRAASQITGQIVPVDGGVLA